MQPMVRPILISLAIAAILFSSINALACQETEQVPLQQQFDEALGVVHVRVIRAEVTTTDELGIECNAVICDLLKVRLDIRETFKGDPDDYVDIYASIPTMCIVPIIAGWEYVLFFVEYEGLIFPDQNSFMFRGDMDDQRLLELRGLGAR